MADKEEVVLETNNISKARITFVGTVYHQLMGPEGEDPTNVEIREEHMLMSDDMPYGYRTKKSAPLDTGWIEQVGMVVIKNVGVAAASIPALSLRIPGRATTVVYPESTEFELEITEETVLQVTVYPK